MLRAPIVEHMNADHQAAMRGYVRRLRRWRGGGEAQGMPGCVLHVQGRGLACPPELETLRAPPDGFAVLVSDAGGDSFARQVEDAISFLEAHAPVLAAVRSAGAFDGAELDFGVWSRNPVVLVVL